MEKMKMHTPNFTDGNIAKLAELFPNCVTETKGDDGEVKHAIDFDALRQEFSETIVEGSVERYSLNWPGKREALVMANTPISKTLRPCVEDSVNFDTTKNIFIEGDNLDALKLLQESYLGKVKMIYIDPPYNTGNDFIYSDNFTADKAEFDEASGQKNEEGGRLVANPDSNGRFHSDWLSMLYPRIRLARNLMHDDGVIFVSIGEDELSNLKKIITEVFGQENYVSTFVWEKRTNRENRKVVSYRHDYILCLCKRKRPDAKALYQVPMTEKALSSYKNPDNDPNGLWKSDPATAQSGHATKSQFYTLIAPNGKAHEPESGRCWLYTQGVMNQEIAEGRIWFGQNGGGVPRIKTYLNAKERGLTPETILFAEEVATNEHSKKALKELFDGIAVFETPKPVALIQQFLKMSCKEGIVLDFFAGSGATSHAVMKLNAEDSGRRVCISVQLPEKTGTDSDAHKAGYKNIAEITKERIRRAGKKIKEENADKEGIENLDVGFRVFKIDSSNMQDVHLSPDETKPDMLTDLEGNIKADRTGEDLLFQVLLDWGVDLSLPIEIQTIDGKEVFFVDDNALAACFDEGINEDFVKLLAAKQPLRVVFRDDGFASDSVKINVEQIFKLKSPSTDIRVI